MNAIRVVLFNVGMTLIAGVLFVAARYVFDTYGPAWADKEQAAAVACLLVALMPVLAYARSRTLRDRLVTAAQTVTLVVTAVFAGLVAPFMKDQALAFMLWFLTAADGVAIAVWLTFRLADKNGKRLSAAALEERQQELGDLRLQEVDLQRVHDTLLSQRSATAKEAKERHARNIARVQQRIRILEDVLRAHGALLPIVVFSIGDADLREADEDTQPSRARAVRQNAS